MVYMVARCFLIQIHTQRLPAESNEPSDTRNKDSLPTHAPCLKDMRGQKML